jgi:hypothetical protein
MYVVLIHNPTGLPHVVLENGEEHIACMQAKSYSLCDSGTKTECNVIANSILEELSKEYCLS